MPLQGPILRPYQVQQPQGLTQNDINSSLNAYIQGQRMANLPQILSQQQAQQQAQLLNQQLHNQLLQAQLQDALHPELKAARDATNQLALKSLDQFSGVVPMVEGKNSVGGVPVALPGTVTPQRQAQINTQSLADYNAAASAPSTMEQAPHPGAFNPMAPAAQDFPAAYVAPNLGAGEDIAAKQNPSAYTMNGKNLGYLYDPNAQQANEERQLSLKSKYASNNFTPIGMSGDGKSIVGYNRATDAVESKPIPQGSGDQGTLAALPGKGGKTTSLTPNMTPQEARAQVLLEFQTGQKPSFGMGQSADRNLYTKTRGEMLLEEGHSPAQVAANQAQFIADKKALGELTAQEAKIMSFANTADANLMRAEELSRQVDRSGTPVINRWIIGGKKEITGDPDVSAFNAAVNVAVNETAKTLSSATGSGVTSDQARKEVSDILNTAQTPEQFSAVVQVLHNDLGNRGISYKTFKKNLKDAISGEVPQSSGTPSAAPAPGKYKVLGTR